MLRRLRDRVDLAAEDGVSIVLTVLILPTVILMGVFVVDVSKWFVQKRHLQIQADAGALAAAGDMEAPCTAVVDATARDTAFAYAGETYNIRIGAADGESGGEIDVNTSPCADAAIDVTAAETDVPWYFGAASVDRISARARVEIRQVDEMVGSLPAGIEDPRVNAVKAFLVDENQSTRPIIGSALLSTSDGGATWSGVAATNGPLTTSRVGVRIGVSGLNEIGDCGSAAVTCYDGGSVDGVGFIRGHGTQAAPTSPDLPVIRAIDYEPTGTCTSTVVTGACTLGLSVDASFNVASSTTTTKIRARAGSGAFVNLPWDSSTGRYRGSIPVTGATGPVAVDLEWEQHSGQVRFNQNPRNCNANQNNPCKRTEAGLQRVFGLGDESRDGPIESLAVSDVSVPTGQSHAFAITVGIEQETLAEEQDISFDDPSRTGILDCGSGTNLREQLATPCPAFRVWTSADGACPVAADPAPCIPVFTGNKQGQNDGLNDRILEDDPTCEVTKNAWPDYDRGDPRIVPIYIVPRGTFGDQGGGSIPILGFAYFYITSWTDKGNKQNPCGDEHPIPGDIRGRFINYVNTISDGSTGTGPCRFDPDSYAACVALLVE